MTVRPLTEDDAAAFRALRLRGLREEPDAFMSAYDDEARAWTVERIRAQLREVGDAADGAVLGAFEEEALVGVVGIARERERKARHRANLWGMYVAPEARGRGHGRALLDAALAHAVRAQGIEQVHLMVTTGDAARGLYQSAGFAVVGTLPRAMKDGERYLDEEIMVYRLGAATGS